MGIQQDPHFSLPAFPQIQLLFRQRFEEGVDNLDLPLHGTDLSRAPELIAPQLGNRSAAARDDYHFPCLDLRQQR